MNRYPIWKYAFILMALFVGVLYTLPNFFGEAPAVQVSSAKVTVKVDFNMVDRVQKALDDAAIKAERVTFDGASVRVRFDNTDTQIKAKDVMARALNPDAADPSFIVALNLLSRSPAWLASVRALPMYLGLDLRGGVHFLMQVDMRSAVKQQLDAYQSEVRGALREKRIRFTGLTRDGDGLSVVIPEAASVAAARDLLSTRLTTFAWTEDKVPEGTRLVGRLSPKAMGDIGNQALTQNIETLHKRVNELGVAEPVIQRQGADRVVVQLPGVQDTARAKDIIGRTATLQLRLVDQAGTGSETVPVRLSPGETVQRTVSLKREVIATGEQLEKASATLDENQRPAVSVNLNDAAGRAMRNVTRENMGKPMAIVLYEKGKGEAVSVATIQGEFGNQFRITGNFTPQETADIALLTRAGALAAPMEIIEERTIGPSLGAENITKGFNSVIYGFAAIALFMCAYYVLFGVISTLALAFNLLLLVAVLSMLQATLTLPGIAAIALTLGMAIDANVLINERVREELRNGMPPQSAIHAGYERAWATILDSNVTTLIAGVALLAFGSGPVRGFAVVHCLGILTSMFSAVVFSRALVNLWYGRQKKLKGVSIGQVWRPAAVPEGAQASTKLKA